MTALYVTACFGRSDGGWTVIYVENGAKRSAVSLTRLEVGQRFYLEAGRAVPVEQVRHG
jgi:hypothetical protein